MNLKKALENLYITICSDEQLLRLLHYIPKNAMDDPLDVSKPDVSTKPPEEFDEIVRKSIIPSDKTNDLVTKTQLCRICFYTGTRKPQSNYSGSSRQLINNPYASDQNYNFDVYVHVDIDIVDFRLTAICDRLNELLLLNPITDVGAFILDFSSPIGNTPDGFIGYKLVYTATSLQESSKRVRIK